MVDLRASVVLLPVGIYMGDTEMYPEVRLSVFGRRERDRYEVVGALLSVHLHHCVNLLSAARFALRRVQGRVHGRAAATRR